MKDVDDRIEEYRRQLRAQGELAESDLDELEDHLRELTNELLTAGKPAAEAVTEAARRLGDPRHLAREHARVRSQFGAPLSPGRALSGAVLFVLPFFVFYASNYGELEFFLPACFVLAAFVVIAIALAARMTWARAVVLGVTMHSLLARLLILDPHPFQWSVEVGILVFVMPWRRNEFSLAAINLALQAWATICALWALTSAAMGMQSARVPGCVYGTIALVCAVASCFGTVHRARWSAISSGVSALALFGALHTLGLWPFRPDDPLEFQLMEFGTIGSGAIAAMLAAVLGWRTTRSTSLDSQRRSLRRANRSE